MLVAITEEGGMRHGKRTHRVPEDRQYATADQLDHRAVRDPVGREQHEEPGEHESVGDRGWEDDSPDPR